MHYPFSLPPLPYPYDALVPELDERTLHFHHDKHFATYVENLNKLLESHPAYHSWSLEQLIQGWPEMPEEVAMPARWPKQVVRPAQVPPVQTVRRQQAAPPP